MKVYFERRGICKEIVMNNDMEDLDKVCTAMGMYNFSILVEHKGGVSGRHPATDGSELATVGQRWSLQVFCLCGDTVDDGRF
jgi:hypothetical protein